MRKGKPKNYKNRLDSKRRNRKRRKKWRKPHLLITSFGKMAPH